MSINFATLQNLEIPEGVVTQIEKDGVVLWMLGGGKVVLEVAKVTKSTYAGETKYENEQFILLDVYPKTNGTVNVTYGDLTKTITDTSGVAEPNAVQVFFGTFNGVSDSVETPESGRLTIDGDYRGVGIGSYASNSKGSTTPCSCVRRILGWGSIEIIPPNAFYSCGPGLLDKAYLNIPDGVTTIGDDAFYSFRALKSVSIPASVTHIGNNPWCFAQSVESLTVAEGNTAYKLDENCLIEFSTSRLIWAPQGTGVPSYVTSIDEYAFYENTNITGALNLTSVTSIGDGAFSGCTGLTSVTIGNSVTSIGTKTFDECTGLTSMTIGNSVTSIDNQSFNSCTSLTSVTVLATTPPAYSGASVLFYECTALATITVPAGCGEAYKAANGWSEYADYIVEAS